MGRTAEPGPAHQALMADLHAVRARYESMASIERIAVIAQFLGQQTAEVGDQYSNAEILAAISHNLASGNQQAGAPTLVINGRG